MIARGEFPLLQTARLQLRQLRSEDDAGALFDCFSRDDVTAYYDLESFTSRQQAVELIESWNERFANGEGIRFAITLHSSTDRVIGTCGFHNWAKEHFKAEVGYELHPDYWRQGVMTEALDAVVRYGFAEMGLNRIDAFIDPANESSRRLLAKCGFREEGTMRDYFFEKNSFVDAVLFGLLKRDLALQGGD
ncbi:GNAT family N-acetyltransferase [Paenibacillus silvisoli]|uniref:GNAT family N-acetyltransferase n=1 Tax=Paenibacillus silvisoli TaxID=3110539 RepID=UPI002804B4D6|nr:GNAT family protein [Paenibacillus silvisoli]